MTISTNDAMLIAHVCKVLWQIGATAEQMKQKPEEDIRSLIVAMKAEGAKVEVLTCYRELFPEGLTVAKSNEAHGLPVVYTGGG